MSIALKYSSPYLPYKVQVRWIQPKEHKNSFWKISEKDHNKEMNVVIMAAMSQGNKNYKLILRSLENLFDLVYPDDKDNSTTFFNLLEEETDGSSHEVEFIDHIKDFNFKLHEIDWMHTPYRLMLVLLSYHFDVFGLIPKGLAEDINNIKNK